jgi:glucosamine-6-phosphate deaminase
LRVEIRDEAKAAVRDAAELLDSWIRGGLVKRLMVAGGNTPLPLYEEIARRGVSSQDLEVFVLDEYVGVPDADPRTCTNLLRRTVAEAWRVPAHRFFGLTATEAAAADAVRAHERRIEEKGGLDGIVLGLGQNGHLGFNEPGSLAESTARMLDLDPVSIEANRSWFGGEQAPRLGATVGLRTILAARHVLLLAFGPGKSEAAHAMVRGPRSPACPASFLQAHRDAHVFLDRAAARRLEQP